MNYPIENIKTERLHIRKLTLSDVKSIFEIFSKPDVTRYWGINQMTSLSDAQDFIDTTKKGFQDHSLLQWGIVQTNTQRLIGTCAYASWDRDNKRAEIGFALNKDSWGDGLMKELLSVFIPFGFDELELHRIEADVDPRNIASIKLLEHFGFKREGYLRERHYKNNEFQDAIFYGLLISDYNNSL